MFEGDAGKYGTNAYHLVDSEGYSTLYAGWGNLVDRVVEMIGSYVVSALIHMYEIFTLWEDIRRDATEGRCSDRRIRRYLAGPD